MVCVGGCVHACMRVGKGEGSVVSPEPSGGKKSCLLITLSLMSCLSHNRPPLPVLMQVEMSSFPLHSQAECTSIQTRGGESIISSDSQS